VAFDRGTHTRGTRSDDGDIVECLSRHRPRLRP
jgi:hypothetical protein